MSVKKKGTVYLVGAGCGDYDLITLRGKTALEQCDTVIYDSLIDDRILNFASSAAEKISVGKRCGKHSETQENINSLLVSKATEGKTVVRLKGGDPFVFGRGGEEIIELKKNDIEFDIIPGISSSIAVPELAGIPVTHRKVSRSFHVITGHTADDFTEDSIKKYAELEGTLVFLMGLKNLRYITDSLIKYGKDKNMPACVISNGAGSYQSIVKSKLIEIADEAEKQNAPSPAVIVIGKTVEYDFAPTVSRPLSGITVTATGTKRFVTKLSKALENKGARVQRLDHLDVVEYSSNERLDKALKNISDYDFLVLTSINGAEIFLRKLREFKVDIRKLANIKIAVIGSGTAEVLEKRGIFPDLIPKQYTSESLGKMLSKAVAENERVLILRAEKGSKMLTEILDKNQALYDDIKIYDVAENSGFYEENKIVGDYVIFASSSGVRAFFDSEKAIPKNAKIVCIGDITAQAVRQHGINDFRISKTSNIEGIIETIINAEEENETIKKAQSE